jgi:membrane-associated phospholipid phosphatase
MPRVTPKSTNARRLALAAAGLTAVVFAVWGVIEATGAFPGDRLMRPYLGDNPSWLAAHDVPRWLQSFVGAVTWLGSPIAACLIVAALTLALWLRGGPRLAWLPVAAASVVFASAALKELLGPSPLETKTAFSPTGTLPSTHTAFAAAVLGLAAWLAVREARRGPAIVLALVVALIGPLRVLEGAHWPSDVVAGYALGLAWLFAVLALAGRAASEQRRT